MKNLCVFALSLLLLAGCATENGEPLPYEVALQPCGFQFTEGPYILITKHTGAYATVEKRVYKDSFTNLESISFHFVIEGYNEQYLACNLPEILKKDGQKIKFNGTTMVNTNPLADTQPFLEFNSVRLMK